MERLKYIDLIKFFAIFCVAIGHILQIYYFDNSASYLENIVFSAILSFHMPLFAFISGMFLKLEGSYVQNIKRKTIQLLFPYISWILVFLILPDIFRKIYEHYLGLEPFHFMAVANNIYFAFIEWGLWFVRALFLCFLVGFLCRGRFSMLLLISSIFLISAISFIGIIPNKSNFWRGFVFLYPFFVSGKLFMSVKTCLSLRKQKALMFCRLILWIVLFSFWKGLPDTYYGMNTSIFETSFNPNYPVIGIAVIGKTLFRFLIGLSACCFIVLLFQIYIDRFCDKCILSTLCFVGQYTLLIYVLHGHVISALCDYIT